MKNEMKELTEKASSSSLSIISEENKTDRCCFICYEEVTDETQFQFSNANHEKCKCSAIFCRACMTSHIERKRKHYDYNGVVKCPYCTKDLSAPLFTINIDDLNKITYRSFDEKIRPHTMNGFTFLTRENSNVGWNDHVRRSADYIWSFGQDIAIKFYEKVHGIQSPMDAYYLDVIQPLLNHFPRNVNENYYNNQYTPRICICTTSSGIVYHMDLRCRRDLKCNIQETFKCKIGNRIFTSVVGSRNEPFTFYSLLYAPEYDEIFKKVFEIVDNAFILSDDPAINNYYLKEEYASQFNITIY